MNAGRNHIYHLYENLSLTVKEMKNIFKKIDEGKLLATEKIDGQRLWITFSVKENRAKAARNHKHIYDGGILAENVSALTEVSHVAASFGEAIKIFEETVKKIPIHDQVEIFGPNKNFWYKCEIQDPNNINVLLYEQKALTFHRAENIKYNKLNNEIINENLGPQFFVLEKYLKTNNINEQSNPDRFIVRVNELRNVGPLKNRSAYQNALKSLQNELNSYGVSDASPLAEYVLNRLNEVVLKRLPDISENTKLMILKKLMEAKGIHAKDVYKSLAENNLPHLTEEVRSLLEQRKNLLKEAISPIEEIVRTYGSNVLQEFKSSYIKDENKEVLRLRQNLQEIFDIVGSSGNTEAKLFLDNQFSRIKDINNINSACEGIVFKYNGDLYKITGMFSPLNQILGMMNFQRGNVAPLKTMIVAKENLNKTAVFTWGRFNPPTIGHEIVFKCAGDIAKQNKADFFIVPTKTVDSNKNPLTLQEKISYLNKIFPEYNQNVINNPNINTIFEAAKYFSNRGYKNIKLVVGSDRKEQFEVLNKYNKKEYHFDSIEIVSAGERLDEGEGPSSISSSKMRQAAIDGSIENFMKCVAGRLELQEATELMNLIRSRIQIEEDGKKKVLEPISPSLLAEVIRKTGNKWCVLSKSKTKDGKRKKLGCYNSRNGAKKRLRQVEYFKNIKEEKELEEISVAGGGGANLVGHVSRKEMDEEEVEESIYSPKTMTSRFGDSPHGKRDDEESIKQFIKVIIKEEEELMKILREEFVEEMKIRKAIREGLKFKMKERQQKVLQEEKQLRLVIRKLLQEKDEEPPHPITGINVLRDLLKKIVPTIGNSYKQLTTSEEQRKSFRAHLVKKTRDLLRTAETPEEKISVDVELKEQEEEPELSQARQTAKEDPRFIDPFAKAKKPKLDKEPELSPEPEPEDDGLDTTGRDMSERTFNKIKKQIKDAYDILSDERDKDAFSEYLITNELLHMDIFEDDMSTTVEEPTTPSYEKEKNKPTSSETPPETETPPQQTPSPVMERKKTR